MIKIKIALLGDLHFPVITSEDEELNRAINIFFESYLNLFLNIEADFHVSIGDLTHLGVKSEFLGVYEYLKKSEVNFRAVLGNHDVLSLPKEKISSIIQQPLYSAIETEEHLLLFLDTTVEYELHGWGFDLEQWNWLEQQIERAKEKSLLIFAHHPVPETTTFSPNKTDLVDSLQDIRPLLKKRENIVLYFNGHTHLQSYFQQHNFHFIQAGAAICDPDILVIELIGNEVKIEKVNIENQCIEDNRAILYKKLPDFHRPNLISG